MTKRRLIYGGLTFAAFALLAVLFVADVIAYRETTPLSDLHMELRIASVDTEAKSFIASVRGGDQEVYHVDGDMPLVANQFVRMNYRPVFRWYKFFWQDDNEIHINEVNEEMP